MCRRSNLIAGLCLFLLWFSAAHADETGAQSRHADETGARPRHADETGAQLRHADEPGARPQSADEPGLLSPPNISSGFWRLRDRGPLMKFSYRTFSIPEMGQRSARFHLFSVDRYFISRIFRAAGGLEGGYAKSSLNYLFFGATVTVGLQYPCRLTPFFDVVSSFGVARREVLHQNLFGFSYHLGLEAGFECYFLEKLLLSFSLGWRHPVLYHPGNDDVEAVYLYYDSFTLKMGLGF